MSEKDAPQAKLSVLSCSGFPNSSTHDFLRKIGSIFAQKWNENREKVRSILSEVHAKIVGAFKIG